MASSIPLPALDIRPPAPPPSPLDEYARVANIKNALLGQQVGQAQLQGQQMQNQQQQLALQDDQKWRSVMSSPDWDGTPEGLLKQGLKQGVGPKSYLGMQQSILEMKQKAATLTGDQLKNEAAIGDQYRGQLTSIINGPDSQKQTAWGAAVTQAEQAGHIQPGSMTHQYPGDDTAQSLANHFALGSTLAKEASEQQQAAARKQASQTGANRLAAEQNPQSPLYAPTPAAVAMGSAPGASAIQAGQTAQAGNVAGAQAAAKQPYELQLANVRAQVQQTFQNNKDAQDKIESNVLKPYQDKMSSISELQSALTQASQGNVTAARGALLKLMGVTNPDGTRRYNEAEASRMLSQGSVPQQVAGSIQNALTGNNWTPKMIADMQQFAAGQGAVAGQSLNSGIDNVNKLYNTSVGGGLRQSPTQQPAAANPRAAAPPAQGFTRIQASDGSVHDLPSQNLARARQRDPGLQVVQ